VLHPTAKKMPNGAWRIPAADLGRPDLQEDLSFHSSGITYFGEEDTFTAVDAVMRFGGAPDAKSAAFWLCQQMGIEPASMGWKESEKPSGDDAETDNSGQKKKSKVPTQAQILIRLATGDGIELYRSADGSGYADVFVNNRRETWPLKGAGFKRWLRHRYYQETGGAPNGEAMGAAMGVIEARAAFEGPVRAVHLRVAEQDGSIYLDLCDRDGKSSISRPCDSGVRPAC
jgi:hypothetical protein